MKARGDVALALLVGGRSRRMGQDKALAPFAGTTVIEYLLDRLSPGFAHTFLVAKDVGRFRHLGVPVVADARVDDGPTLGVYTALLASPASRTLCLGCDMPFVTADLLDHLADLSPAYEALVPRDETGLQPLCAVYAREALPALEHMLDTGERRLYLIVDRVQAGFVDVAAADLGDPRLLFFNMNTAADLDVAQRLAVAQFDEKISAAETPGGALPGARGIGVGVPEPGHDPFARLDPRVTAFMARVAVPTVSFVGKKKSAKTTVLEGVIAELVHRGMRVAAIKHDAHRFSIDIPGTDTHRLRAAGAQITLISSPEAVAVMTTVNGEASLVELTARVSNEVDLVLTEGFMRQPAPKVEVSRAARSTTLISPPGELLAVVADHRPSGVGVPRLGLDDFAGVADVLEQHMGAYRMSRILEW